MTFAVWKRHERVLLLVLALLGTALVLAEPLFGEACTLSFEQHDPRLDLRPWARGAESLPARNPITPDIDGFVLPGLARARQLLADGGPWWDDSQLLGYPFAANMPVPLAAPTLALLQAVADDPVDVLDLSLALHLALALVLAYRACRHLSVDPAFACVGAVGFAFSGWMLTHWHAPHIVYTTCWWPAQLVAVEWARRRQLRRALLEGSLATGLMLLSGFPQVALVLTGASLLWALLGGGLPDWRGWLVVAGLALGGLALAAPQLTLSATAYAGSSRATPETRAEVAARGLPPMSLVAAALPEFFGHPPDFSLPDAPAPSMQAYLPQRRWWSDDVQNSVVENVLYSGGLVLLLACGAWTRHGPRLARRLILLAGLAVLACLLAPVATAAWPATRGLAVGSVKRALVLVGACLPLAGAVTLQGLAQGRARVPWRAGLVLLLGVLALPWLARLLDEPDAAAFSARLVPQALRQAAVYASALAALWLLSRAASLRSPALRAAVCWLPALLLTADLVSLARDFNPFPRQSQAFPATPALAELGQRSGRVAVFGPSASWLPATAAGLHGLRVLHGVAPMLPARTAELLACIEGPLADPRDPRVLAPLSDPASLSHPLLDLLGVDTVVHADPGLATRTGLPPLFERPEEGLAALARPTAGPRAFLCSSARVLPAAHERLAWLADRRSPVLETVLLERPPDVPLPTAAGRPLQALEVSEARSWLHDRRTLEVQATQPGVVVLTEAWDPGWSVSVDGAAAELQIVDHALLGVVLPAGAHTVTFEYEPPGLVAAAALSGATLLGLLWLAAGLWRARRERAQPTAARTPAGAPTATGGPAHTSTQAARAGLVVPRAPRAAADLGPFEGQAVSIIIPAYDDSPRLRRVLWSLRETADMPYELIVSRARQCVARNRNAGLDRASHDLIVFLDDDVLLPAGWLSRLVAVLGSAPDIGAVSAHLAFPDGSPQTRRHDLAPGEHWQVTIPGTCFAYSRGRVADQRFDEVYQGSQWEDTDWMWAVHERGLRTLMTGDVSVLHDHAASQNRWMQENGAYFLFKWKRLPGAEETSALPAEEHAAWQAPELPAMPPVPGRPDTNADVEEPR